MKTKTILCFSKKKIDIHFTLMYYECLFLYLDILRKFTTGIAKDIMYRKTTISKIVYTYTRKYFEGRRIRESKNFMIET